MTAAGSSLKSYAAGLKTSSHCTVPCAFHVPWCVWCQLHRIDRGDRLRDGEIPPRPPRPARVQSPPSLPPSFDGLMMDPNPPPSIHRACLCQREKGLGKQREALPHGRQRRLHLLLAVRVWCDRQTMHRHGVCWAMRVPFRFGHSPTHDVCIRTHLSCTPHSSAKPASASSRDGGRRPEERRKTRQAMRTVTGGRGGGGRRRALACVRRLQM